MRISVVIPVFNVEGYLADTLRSLQSQSFGDFEVVVVDDGSTDTTLAVARSFESTDSRIRVVENRGAKGVSGARNFGISLAKGRWLCFLDGDDLLHEDALAEKIKASDSFPDALFFGGDFMRFRENPDISSASQVDRNPGWNRRFLSAKQSGVPCELRDPVESFLSCVLTWTGVVMVDADLVRSLGGFDEEMRMGEDDHLWIRLAAHSQSFVFVPKSISFYRVRDGSLTNSSKSPTHNLPMMFDKLLGDPAFRAYSTYIRLRRNEAVLGNSYFYRRSGDVREAFFWAFQAVLLAPWRSEAWRCLLGAVFFR